MPPASTSGDRQSANHGGRGQNVLFESGRVGFVTSPRSTARSDHFFLNDDGQVAAGTHAEDSVIGSSHTGPLPTSNPR